MFHVLKLQMVVSLYIHLHVRIVIIFMFQEPILTIRLELVEQTVSFSPPLDRSSSVDNVEDATNQWLETYLRRANLVNHLTVSSCSFFSFSILNSPIKKVWQGQNTES